MPLIAIELNDAGLMAAAGDPPHLLALDGSAVESPGYFLPQKKNSVVGQSAADQAHLFPHQVQHRFWDQLSTEPLKNSPHSAANHAQMAHDHLAHVWEHLRPSGTSAVFTLPGSFSRDQMGLLLGVTRELGIEVKGLVNQALAAAPHPFAVPCLLYLDIGLHRTELSLLSQNQQLKHEKTVTLDKGLISLHRAWIDAIAAEFVAGTRFDPLHNAASEQDLYNRLPAILTEMTTNATVPVKVRSDHNAHTISLGQELLIRKSRAYYQQVSDLIRSLLDQQDRDISRPMLLLSHRFAQLPGAQRHVARHPAAHTHALKPGAGALNLLHIWDRLQQPAAETGAFFFSQRPWTQPDSTHRATPSKNAQPANPPTHLLREDLAYAIDESPLSVIRQPTPQGVTIAIQRNADTTAQTICTLHRQGGQVMLTVTDLQTVYLDDEAVREPTALSLGRTLSFESIDDTLRLIVCL